MSKNMRKTRVLQQIANLKLSLLSESNQRPTDYKSVALPAELRRLMWCGQESNLRHKDFQSFALPTELPHQVKIMVGFPLHPTLYCFLSFLKRSAEGVDLFNLPSIVDILDRETHYPCSVCGIRTVIRISCYLITCTRAHDCIVLSKSTLCVF